MNQLRDFWVQGDRNAEKMWASWQDKHRNQVLVALSCIPPFKRVYELGCGSGPNLRLIIHHRPETTVSGCEPNESLAAWASEHLGVPIDRHELPEVPSDEWDVFLSCYTMAYVDRETAKQTLTNLRGRNLVLIEPTAGVAPFGPAGVYEGHAMPSYVHDYMTLCQETGWSQLWRWPLYPHHQGLNTVLIAERS